MHFIWFTIYNIDLKSTHLMLYYKDYYTEILIEIQKSKLTHSFTICRNQTILFLLSYMFLIWYSLWFKLVYRDCNLFILIYLVFKIKLFRLQYMLKYLYCDMYYDAKSELNKLKIMKYLISLSYYVISFIFCWWYFLVNSLIDFNIVIMELY